MIDHNKEILSHEQHMEMIDDVINPVSRKGFEIQFNELHKENKMLNEETKHYMELAGKLERENSGLSFRLEVAVRMRKNLEAVIRDLKYKDLLADEGIDRLKEIIAQQTDIIYDLKQDNDYYINNKNQVYLIIENGKVSKIFKAEICAREYLEAENKEAYSVESLASMTPYELD